MWKSKKFFLVVVLAVVVLVGGAAGIVLAQTEEGDGSQPETLLARVAGILNIDQAELADAFAQARSEMRAEALDRYLQYQVDQGKITQDEADQYKEWWQARPDTSLPKPFGRFGSHGFRGGMKWGGGHGGWGGHIGPDTSGS